MVKLLQRCSCLWGTPLSNIHASLGRPPNQNPAFTDESSVLKALGDSGSGDLLHSYLPKNYPEAHQIPTPICAVEARLGVELPCQSIGLYSGYLEELKPADTQR